MPMSWRNYLAVDMDFIGVGISNAFMHCNAYTMPPAEVWQMKLLVCSSKSAKSWNL